ncbi:MAG: hypothetical protein QM669_01125 [Siphonobacter sp.]
MKIYLLLLFSTMTCASAQLPAWQQVLPAYANKKIVSIIKAEGSTGASDTPGPLMSGAIPTSVVKTTSTANHSRTISIMPEASGYKIARTFTRIFYRSKDSQSTSEYDSENLFERDQLASAQGQQYDPLIKKKHITSYKPGETTTVLDTYDAIWIDDVPILVPIAELVGIVMPIANQKVLAPGYRWKDQFKLGNHRVSNEFKVVSVAKGVATVEINGQMDDEISPTSSFAYGNIVFIKTSYTGTLHFNMDNLLITSGTFLTTIERSIQIMGSYNNSKSVVKSEITNTIAK